MLWSMEQDRLAEFEQLARTRRAVRQFKPDPLPEGTLDRLLDAARWAPSGYNLQPTSFVVVTGQDSKASLCKACMNQRQINDAPAIVVFLGNRRVAQHHFEKVLAADYEAGAINETYEKLMRKFVPLAMSTSPMGLGWFGKAAFGPLMGLFTPMPMMPAVHRHYWLGKQASLCAMNFMLAAHAAGLATCPMEGFDTRRVRKLVAAPSYMLPVLVVPVGYAESDGLVKSRLPLGDLVHRERWNGEKN